MPSNDDYDHYDELVCSKGFWYTVTAIESLLVRTGGGRTETETCENAHAELELEPRQTKAPNA